MNMPELNDVVLIRGAAVNFAGCFGIVRELLVDDNVRVEIRLYGAETSENFAGIDLVVVGRMPEPSSDDVRIPSRPLATPSPRAEGGSD